MSYVPKTVRCAIIARKSTPGKSRGKHWLLTLICGHTTTKKSQQSQWRTARCTKCEALLDV